MLDDEGTSEQQLVGACFDDAEVLQQVLIGDAFLRTEHLVNCRTITPGLREQTTHACDIMQQHARYDTMRYDTTGQISAAAARVLTGTRKFDRGLGQILHDQLHWLDVPDRLLSKLAVTVHQCQHKYSSVAFSLQFA